MSSENSQRGPPFEEDDEGEHELDVEEDASSTNSDEDIEEDTEFVESSSNEESMENVESSLLSIFFEFSC